MQGFFYKNFPKWCFVSYFLDKNKCKIVISNKKGNIFMNAFEKVIGYDSVKREVERVCDIIKNGDKYKKLGVKIPSGMLLYGAPGVGKTLISNCLIEESGRKVFVCRKNLPKSEFIKFIKDTFEQAKNNTPSIVFLDDFEVFLVALVLFLLVVEEVYQQLKLKELSLLV